MANASRCGRGLLALMAVLTSLPGCGGEDPVDRTSGAPVPTPTPVATATFAPTPTPTPDAIDISRDKVERGVALPPTATAARGDFVVNVTPKRFVDPPLPPELNDDGGLKPLPKPGR